MKHVEPVTQQEMRREIDSILDRADLQERRMFPLMFQMLKNVGLSNCFVGVKWAPLLCLLVGLFSLEYYRQQSSLNSIFQFTMFIQPLLLTGISTLACIIGKHQGVWEMSAVCKYNDKYLLAFRMLCMGFLGMASTVFTLLSVKNEGGIIFFKAFLASTASYLLCGSILMAALRLLPEKWFWPVVVGWCVMELFLMSRAATLNLVDQLGSTPLIVVLAASVITAVLYLWQTRQIALSNKKTGGYWKC